MARWPHSLQRQSSACKPRKMPLRVRGHLWFREGEGDTEDERVKAAEPGKDSRGPRCCSKKPEALHRQAIRIRRSCKGTRLDLVCPFFLCFPSPVPRSCAEPASGPLGTVLVTVARLFQGSSARLAAPTATGSSQGVILGFQSPLPAGANPLPAHLRFCGRSGPS